MQFDLQKSIEILERTPEVLHQLLHNLSDDWITKNEGSETWSPYDVIGHLIHGEKTDWIPRTEIILSKKGDSFEPFNRFAQFENSKGKTLNELLEEFQQLRAENIQKLKGFNIKDEDLLLEGTHPELGKVLLKNLLSTWVVHDLGHIAQISRVMAKQYSSEVGVWHQYLGILSQ